MLVVLVFSGVDTGLDHLGGCYLMNLIEWAIRWSVPYEAVEDMRRLMGTVDTDPPQHPGESEAAIQNRIRLEASSVGSRLLRNNVGAFATEDGSFVRYGLANDSQQMNKKIKSSDLIGLRPVTVTPPMVGAAADSRRYATNANTASILRNYRPWCRYF